MMQDVKKICLSCHYYRLTEKELGLCRVDKKLAEYPKKLTEDSCGKWRDAGQQYYIRLGWIKAQTQENDVN